jgi:putative effector of murein hydrolase LrgA (UPF0299 family)
MYNTSMKTLLNKLAIPFAVLLSVNAIGFVYYKNFEGAVIGSIVGMVVAFLATEIRAKFD